MLNAAAHKSNDQGSAQGLGKVTGVDLLGCQIHT
jgi:hypothetical protein